MCKYRNVAFLFPGQGAQYVGMGRDFFQSFSTAKETFKEGDEILERKLSSIVFSGPEDRLTETKNSQPAIFLNSAAIMRVIAEQFPSLRPNVCAGLSLGEYTAVMASEKLAFSDALRLVQYRANYMNEACEKNLGEMAVVMGLDHSLAENIVKEINMPNDLWTANFNCPGQVVISGTPKGIKVAKEIFKEGGARRILPLTVHGAFHSGLMDSAEKQLADKVLRAPFSDSSISLVMNFTGDYVSIATDIKRHLVSQVTNPVRWEKGIRSMLCKGVDLFLEIGCGNTLSGMNKRIGVDAPVLNIDKVEDLNCLDEILNK